MPQPRTCVRGRGGIALTGAVWVIGTLGGPVDALDIAGIQNASLDQPRINAALRRPGDTGPLTATFDFLGLPIETFTIQAFYDTGASGVVVSDATAKSLDLVTQLGVVFGDVGVGGEEEFSVSEEIHVHLAPFGPSGPGIDDPTTFNTVYNQQFGPLRAQVSAPASNSLLAGLDIFGMPVFAGKTVVMDARPVNQVVGTIETSVYDSVPNNPNVPLTHRHIQTGYTSFARFTRTFARDEFGNETPLDTETFGPALAHNPFVGPNPLGGLDGNAPDTAPGITTTYNSVSSTGSWLYDTGAVTSIISEHQAAAHGVGYLPDDGNPLTPPVLVGVPLSQQFFLTIGGVGGFTQKAGFFLDSLLIPTTEGDPDDLEDPMHLRYVQAPVLVADINLEDPVTGDTLTLDGILGMNYQVASLFSSEPFSLGDLRAGPFDFITFDEPTGIVGLRFDADVLTPGDLNGDGSVDNLDIAVFLTAVLSSNEADFHAQIPWGIYEAADFNSDGGVGAADAPGFIDALASVGATAPQALVQLVPEPGTLLVFAIGGPLTLRRRR